MGTRIGVLNVRRNILIEANAARVWAEFMNFQTLNAWFGIGHKLETYEPGLGGKVELSIENDGETIIFGGKILTFDAGQELTFENNWFSDSAWPVPTFITLRLSDVYQGTLVELFHHGFERLGADASVTLADYEDGWHAQHLITLRNIVEGIDG